MACLLMRRAIVRLRPGWCKPSRARGYAFVACVQVTCPRASSVIPWRAVNIGNTGWCRVLTLYSYPELFGVADNNPYGLKIFTFLKLTKVPFRHEHIFDASAAPRGQLPYIVDEDQAI